MGMPAVGMFNKMMRPFIKLLRALVQICRQCFVTVCRESVGEVGTVHAPEVTEQQGAVDMSLVSAGEQLQHH